MCNEFRYLLFTREHQDDLQMSLRYQCLQQLLQQVACPGIQPYKGIVQYQDLRISQQSLGELKLTHLATGQQDDVFVQQRTDTEDIEQPLLPLFVFGIRHQSTHQRRRLHILRVPSLLIVMSTVGIAIRVAESDILDVITYQPGGRRSEIILYFVHQQRPTARQNIHQQAFPTSIGTYQCQVFSPLHPEVHRLFHPIKGMTGHSILYFYDRLHSSE